MLIQRSVSVSQILIIKCRDKLITGMKSRIDELKRVDDEIYSTVYTRQMKVVIYFHYARTSDNFFRGLAQILFQFLNARTEKYTDDHMLTIKNGLCTFIN